MFLVGIHGRAADHLGHGRVAGTAASDERDDDAGNE